MEKKSDDLINIANIEKKLKGWKKLNKNLFKLVKRVKQDSAPRPSLPISIPFNIFKPKKVADGSTQTDMTFFKQSIVEPVDRGMLSKNIDKESYKHNNHLPTLLNFGTSLSSKEENYMQPTTLISDNIFDENTSDMNPTDLSQNNKIYIMEETAKTMFRPASNKLVQSKEKQTSYKKNNDNNTNRVKTKEINIKNNVNQKITDPDNIITFNDKAVVIDNNVMKHIIDTSENYKQFVNRIFSSIEKLYKTGVFNHTNNKLDTICDVFDSIIVLYISEKEADDQGSSENDPNDKIKDSEIELHLQTMKQERKDDEEDAPGVPEILEPIAEEQIELPQNETVYHDKQQQQVKNNNNYNYNQYHNVYMPQNKNTNASITETRPPCPPSVMPHVNSIPQNETYNNENYYKNQGTTNKNFHYPNKRPYNRQTPYQRYPPQMNQVPMQQPSHTPQTYTYPQYMQQQNVHMQAQMPGMYSQNTPYH